MQVSGKPYEGWMTVIPVTVFMLVIVSVMGGPTAFVNTLSLWVTDTITYVTTWIKYL